MTGTWPRLPGARRLRLSDHETSASELRTGGDGPAHLCVLVHSALLDRHLWSRFATALADRMRACDEPWALLAYDLRAHGDAADAPMTGGIKQLAADLGEVVDLVGADARSVHLAGLSLGGAVVQQAAVTEPGRFSTVTAIGTSSRFPADVMNERARRGLDGVAAQLDDTLARWFTASTLAEGGPAVDYVRECVLATSPQRWAYTWQNLAGFDVADQLPSVQAPVLAVAGSADTAAPIPALATIADRARNGTLVVIDGAAHLIALDQPAELAAATGDFLLTATNPSR
ncbi:alpha/beta fold hydrolase [Labedaea rhizosphaerae]|uniref:3-oxoadipate enol-lactonase n=1 Tax=Labedaea rhizosphaerae TaxID=598644 RepID=A0A4R6SG83_LABRH|nr:alpha/beta hydrolase [Labedaea rhizosphaerae]TDQ00547.1 3-oxoadipate enol-lactonase [Labedaea rhizosphaerae]